MNWYLKALRQYFDFSGRARRKEFWFFVLINIVIVLVLSWLDRLLGLYDADSGNGLLSGLYSLAVLIPYVAVLVRRLHDIGRTGWWALLLLVPVIGQLVLIVFALFDSESGDNRYGPNPKAGPEPDL